MQVFVSAEIACPYSSNYLKNSSRKNLWLIYVTLKISYLKIHLKVENHVSFLWSVANNWTPFIGQGRNEINISFINERGIDE